MPVKKSPLIISEKKKKRNPLIAFMLSLAVTGLGQTYNGSLSKGFSLLAVRTVLLLLVPFSVLARESSSYAATFAALSVAVLLVSLISPIEASITAAAKMETPLRRYNSAYFYGGYAAAALLATALAVSAISSFFTIVRAGTAVSHPAAAPGEYLLVMTYHPSPYSKGDLVVYGGGKIGRVLACPGSTARYERGFFTIDDTPLSFGRWEDDGSAAVAAEHLPFVQIEKGSGREYPVLVDFTSLKAGAGEYRAPQEGYVVCSDNRVPEPAVEIVQAVDITGRVEGIIFSPQVRRILMKPFI